MMIAIAVGAVVWFGFARSGPDGVLEVSGQFMRTGEGSGRTGAAYFVIENNSDQDDFLVSVSSPAGRATLHTSLEDENGVVRMIAIENPLLIAAGSRHELQRGGDHVMLMKIEPALGQGDAITLNLTFEHAGDISIEVPVDQNRP